MSSTVMWFRDDLRLGDHPALCEAVRRAGDGGNVVGLYVIYPGTPQDTAHAVWRCASLAALNEAMDDHLIVRTGSPADVVPQVAREAGAASVHITADATPTGRERDERVRTKLADDDVELVATGSAYAIGPGTITKADGTPYSVFTPFHKAWLAHGYPGPAPDMRSKVPWRRNLTREALPTHDGWHELTQAPVAGEYAALERLSAFLESGVEEYRTLRNNPNVDGTSRLSPYLAHGEIHPRTILAELGRHSGKGATHFRSEVGWREFYGDVLWHHPQTVREYYKPQFARMTYNNPSDALRAWKFGRTGYPFVDAGMRQLRATGWMHNRVRMVVASFLVKDLHIEWTHGAAWFERNLYDLDIASNSHGWQWTAGCGTDAAPYFRVFNPITQGEKFDETGDYVRQWVPELRHLDGAAAHQPWKSGLGYADGYPQRIVDHAEERRVALARYEAVKGT